MINIVVSQDNNITKNKMKFTLSHLYPSPIFADTAIEKEDTICSSAFVGHYRFLNNTDIIALNLICSIFYKYRLVYWVRWGKKIKSKTDT